MGTGNAMQLLAQQNRAMKDKQAAAKAEELRTNLRTGIISVIETLPPIQDGQKPPSLAECLMHIQKPKGYVMDSRRGAFLDKLILNAGVPVWHRNGMFVKTPEEVATAIPTKDVIAAVKTLLQETTGSTIH